jgi:hypothetical protein
VEVRFDPGFEGMRVVGLLKGGGAEVYGSFFEHVKRATRNRLQAVYRSLSISPGK